MKTQRQMMNDAMAKTAEMHETFLEIQDSHTPLSSEEISLLIAKRSDHYGTLHAFAKKQS